jgi:hypothetical protein
MASAVIQLGLVVQHQLAPFDGQPQVVGEVEPVADIDDVAENSKRRPALLGPVHGHVRAPHQFVRATGAAGHGDADAGSQASLDGLERKGLLEVGAHPAGHLEHVLGVRPDQ